MFFDWHPTVVHDLHESVALLMTWNGTGPNNQNIDPVAYERTSRDELSRSRDHDRLRHARGVDLELRRRFRASVHGFGRPESQCHRAAATRPSATAPPRP